MYLIMGNQDWKKARHLARLVLASYKGKGLKDLEDDLNTIDDNEVIDIR